MYKKILAALILLVISITILFKPNVALAQAPQGAWWAPTPDEFNDKVNNPATPQNEIFGERYTQAQVYWIIYSIVNFATDPNVQACAANANGSLATFRDCGLFADAGNIGGVFALANVTGQFFKVKPASGISYVSAVASKIGLPVANAQEAGFGFNTALSPVLSLWTASRNAAYALMTLAIILLAFMVMFRTKISPQASVTVQSAIPRVIIGLLLITFSYAIAGFIIDLSYVVQGIVATLIYGSGLINSNNWTVIDTFNQMNDVGTGVMGYGLLIIAWALVIGGATSLVGVIASAGTTVVVGVIIALIALILFLIALVRIFWVMLKAYVIVIFHVIALPFAALGYVASPSGNMFMQILRSLIGNVSVFVTITIVVMTAHLLFWHMSGAQYSALSTGVATQLFNPYRSHAVADFPTSGGGMPGFGATDMSAIGIFIGLVVLLMASSIANSIKELIITGRMGKQEGMIGAGFLGFVQGQAIGGAERQVLGRLGMQSVNRLQNEDYTGRYGKRWGAIVRGFDTITAGVAQDRGHVRAPSPDKYSFTGQVTKRREDSPGTSSNDPVDEP